MNDAWIYIALGIVFTAFFFFIGVYLRCRRHWHSHLIHFHHSYLGLVLLTGVGVSHYLNNYSYFFASVAAGLILSDAIHHLFFKVPFCWDK